MYYILWEKFDSHRMITTFVGSSLTKSFYYICGRSIATFVGNYYILWEGDYCICESVMEYTLSHHNSNPNICRN